MLDSPTKDSEIIQCALVRSMLVCCAVDLGQNGLGYGVRLQWSMNKEPGVVSLFDPGNKYTKVLCGGY